MMTSFRSVGAGLALVLLAILGTAPASEAGAQQLERLFYYVDTDESFESFRANLDRIDIVAQPAYNVDEDGVVWGEVDPRVGELARANGIAVVPLIHNPGFNQEMLHDLLVNDEARRRTIESLVELCRRHDFDGIQFDFENLNMNDRDAFTRFYREAAEALRAAGYGISVAVVHRPDELPGPTQYHKWIFKNWRAGYDLAALAEAGDFVSVMSYSQHTRRTPPGPEASIPWQRDVAEYFLQFMPPEKLSLGIPLGSQHWYTSQEDDIDPERARSYSRGQSHDRAMMLIERYGGELHWSEQYQVPYAFFQRGGTWEWIFMENARSFQAKLDLARELGLRGFSAWVLGPEDPEVWEHLDW
ncbi:MAG TPA: glycosyl hydrolase family 18 protein [Longimicrobiales bacterium]|nr:glycosyl hydrolase family 18 protein [Longimicrobiales bacterium]